MVTEIFSHLGHDFWYGLFGFLGFEGVRVLKILYLRNGWLPFPRGKRVIYSLTVIVVGVFSGTVGAPSAAA